jgi:phospholipase/carboxylesterase
MKRSEEHRNQGGAPSSYGAPRAFSVRRAQPTGPTRRRLAPVVLVALFAAACDPGPQQAASGVPAQTAASSAPVRKVDVGPAEVSAVHAYTGGAQAGDKVPLVIAVHGLGDKPEAFRGLFQGFPGKAHFVFPAGGLPWGGGFAWWPVAGKIDESSVVPGLDAATDRLAVAIRGWAAAGLAGRPIVTGFSQGGMLSFALAAKHPADIGEALPVSGFAPRAMIPAPWPAGAPLPRIFALHGAADERVPIALAQLGAEKLRTQGVPVELRSYPATGHTISADMRRDLFEALTAAIDRAAQAP